MDRIERATVERLEAFEEVWHPRDLLYKDNLARAEAFRTVAEDVNDDIPGLPQNEVTEISVKRIYKCLRAHYGMVQRKIRRLRIRNPRRSRLLTPRNKDVLRYMSYLRKVVRHVGGWRNSP